MHNIQKQLARLETRHAEATKHPHAHANMLILDSAQMLTALHAIETALNRHPDTCDRYDDNEPISCGWKRAVHDIKHSLEEAMERP